jgi:hypothetical protein
MKRHMTCHDMKSWWRVLTADAFPRSADTRTWHAPSAVHDTGKRALSRSGPKSWSTSTKSNIIRGKQAKYPSENRHGLDLDAEKTSYFLPRWKGKDNRPPNRCWVAPINWRLAFKLAVKITYSHWNKRLLPILYTLLDIRPLSIRLATYNGAFGSTKLVQSWIAYSKKRSSFSASIE